MTCSRSCRCCIIYSIYIGILLFLISIVLFVIIPVVFMYSVELQRSIIFPTHVIEPKNYSDPEKYGITGVRNFYIDVPYQRGENVTLGVWQIIPEEMRSDIVKNEEYNFDGALANDNYNLLIYLHGNGADRASSIELFAILREFFHIFAVDYRGYADSSKAEMIEDGIVNDITYVYKWLKDRSTSRIFIWGHSLGTGVATHLVSNLKKDNIVPSGVILETPFTSVVDVMKTHPIIKFYSFLPWYQATLIDPIETNGMAFDSKRYINDIDCPIMILHAEDDDIIPFKIASDLYNIAIKNRNTSYQGDVTYHLYEANGYGHMFVFLAPHLPKQVKTFVDDCLKFEKKKE